tara:strand:+ start:2083 stop:2577 length:495 start_codon:yes stop_codon:yes gene_type:complete
MTDLVFKFMSGPKNNYEALVLALKLAVDAPTEEQAEKATKMAEEFASTLNEFDIDRAKKEAQVKVCEVGDDLTQLDRGWGDSTIATKYIYEYIDDTLDFGGSETLQNASPIEQLDYLCKELSLLKESLHHAFVSDTGMTVVEHDKTIEDQPLKSHWHVIELEDE